MVKPEPIVKSITAVEASLEPFKCFTALILAILAFVIAKLDILGVAAVVPVPPKSPAS